MYLLMPTKLTSVPEKIPFIRMAPCSSVGENVNQFKAIIAYLLRTEFPTKKFLFFYFLLRF